MQIQFDSSDLENTSKEKRQIARSLAYFILHAIGDIDEIDEKEVKTNVGASVAVNIPTKPTGTAPAYSAPPPPPPPMVQSKPVIESPRYSNPPPPPPAPIVSTKPTISPAVTAPKYSTPPPPPPPPYAYDSSDEDDQEESTVVNFPPPPPPPPPLVNTAVESVIMVPVAPIVADVMAAASAISVSAAQNPLASASSEVDSAGMPWDPRIHGKAKNRKHDGTWKLIKGVDKMLVQQVTQEIANRNQLSLPTTTVPLPPRGNTLPVPPPPPPLPGATVPVPPPPAAGTVGANDPYKELLDKIIAHSKAGKVTYPQAVAICQKAGAPSLTELAHMPHLIKNVSDALDAAALGIPVV